MPAISAFPKADAEACSGWNPQELSLYNKLPKWFIEREVAFRKKYGSYKRIFGSIPWTPNKGSTITGVITEPPPTLRQFAFPNALSTNAAKRDIIQHRERTFDVTLKHHKFESPVFQWLASFEDFIAKKITKNIDFVMRWQENYISQFYRGYMFHQSPAMMFCDHTSSIIDDGAPIGEGNAAGTSGKTDAYLQARLVEMVGAANLSLKNLVYALNYLEEDALAVPYQAGSAKDDSYLNDKFLLITSSETFNSWINDPFLKEMKACDLNVITEGFKGSLMGRVTTTLHSDPLRCLINSTTGAITWPAPHIIQENPAAPNYGQTIVNPDYRNAQIEFSFLCGASGYSVVDVGPPPAEFAQGGADRIGSLKWNGRPRLTDRVNVPCVDGNGTTVQEPNAYDEFLKVISYVVMGIAGETTRNVLPIAHRRTRGISTNLS